MDQLHQLFTNVDTWLQGQNPTDAALMGAAAGAILATVITRFLREMLLVAIVLALVGGAGVGLLELNLLGGGQPAVQATPSTGDGVRPVPGAPAGGVAPGAIPATQPVYDSHRGYVAPQGQ